jgi:iturin family lipopeptide synthetase B
VARAYWSKYLAGYERPCTVPVSGTASPQPGVDCRKTILQIDHLTTRQLIDLAADLQVTLNVVIQGVWGLLLSGYNRVHEVVFGTIVSCRPAELERVEETIGVFGNTVPVRISWAGDRNFSESLKRLQSSALESESYCHLPLSEIQALNPLGWRLFDHLLIFDTHSPGRTDEPSNKATEAGGLSIRELQSLTHRHYNLSLIVVPGDELRIEILSNPRRYPDQQIDRIAHDLETALQNVSKAPSWLTGTADQSGSAEVAAGHAATRLLSNEEPTRIGKLTTHR